VTEGRRAVSLALYQPLNYSLAQIRLLELLPGDDGDKLQCRLRLSHSLYEGGYEALSYVWGDSTNEMKAILVNDTIMEITLNLEMALHCLRYKDKSRTLWIDAVCINQNDHTEKNHQVSLMSDIYSRADRVVVFLGSEDHCSEVFDYFDAISIAVDNGSPLPTSNSSELLLAFRRLLLKPWWLRVWVIQEFALASNDPILGCGRRWTTASTFITGFDALARDFHFQDPLIERELQDVSAVSILKLMHSRAGLLHWPASKNWIDLSMLVRISRPHDSTDPRDKIFALNGLMMEPFRTVLAPDYCQSLRTVYTEMTTLLLCIERWGQIYELLPINANKELPSWVPDFSQHHFDDWRGIASIAKTTQTLTTREIDCCVTMGTLNIRGVDLDTIETIIEVNETDVISVLRILFNVESTIPQEHQKEDHKTGLQYSPRESMGDSLLKLATGLNLTLENFLMASTKKSTRAVRLIGGLSQKGSMSKSDLAKLLDLQDNTLDLEEEEEEEEHQPHLVTLTRDLDAREPAQEQEELSQLKQLETLHLLEEENRRLKEELRRYEEDPLLNEERILRMASHFVGDFLSPAFHSTIFITKLGWLGIGDHGLKKGDKVSILFGIPIPIVLRSGSAPCYHTMVGKARVSGIMNGELMKLVDDGSLKGRLFHVR
jgi:hypothetical protein